jgi:hypothetical protein
MRNDTSHPIPILLITLFELILSVYPFFHITDIRDMAIKLELTHLK